MWANCIDFNLAYYAMRLNKESRKICVTYLTLSLYAYNLLPMGIKVATDVFQATMGEVFEYLNSMIIYLGDILVIGAGSYIEHLTVVSEVLRRLEANGMQINHEKIFWVRPEVEYLGFLITRDGITNSWLIWWS